MVYLPTLWFTFLLIMSDDDGGFIDPWASSRTWRGTCFSHPHRRPGTAEYAETRILVRSCWNILENSLAPVQHSSLYRRRLIVGGRNRRSRWSIASRYHAALSDRLICRPWTNSHLSYDDVVITLLARSRIIGRSDWIYLLRCRKLGSPPPRMILLGSS